MPDDTKPAAGAAATENAQAGRPADEYWHNEALKAIAARDEVKARLRDVEKQLNDASKLAERAKDADRWQSEATTSAAAVEQLRADIAAINGLVEAEYKQRVQALPDKVRAQIDDDKIPLVKRWALANAITPNAPAAPPVGAPAPAATEDATFDRLENLARTDRAGFSTEYGKLGKDGREKFNRRLSLSQRIFGGR